MIDVLVFLAVSLVAIGGMAVAVYLVMWAQALLCAWFGDPMDYEEQRKEQAWKKRYMRPDGGFGHD